MHSLVALVHWPSRCLVVLAIASVATGVRGTSVAVFTAQDERAGPQAPKAPGSNLETRLDDAISSRATQGFSGVVLVARQGRILLHKSYDRNGRFVSNDLAFRTASLTKQFTAAAVLKLAEQGKLALSDPIGQFISDVPADKRSITIHHLLTHTWGSGTTSAVEGVADRTVAVRRILETPLEGPVGAGWRYSNEGYVLAAAIVEVLSGRSWERFVRDTLLAPAGMTHTGFVIDEARAPVRIAAPHPNARNQVFYRRMFRDDRPVPNWGARGATGMYSTAADLYRWLEAIRTTRILSAASWAAMFAPHVPVTDDGPKRIHYGYAWYLDEIGGVVVNRRTNGRADWMHDGYMVLTPTGDEVVVLGYDLGPDVDPVFVDVARDVTDILNAVPQRSGVARQ